MLADKERTMSALRAFLGELIDDAGLFPPAALGMSEALEAHERAEAGAEYWMLGRFVVPAARLGELTSRLDDSPDPLALSVVLDPRAAALELAAAARSETERGDRLVIEAVECRLQPREGGASLDPITALADAFRQAGFQEDPTLFVELPANDARVAESCATLRRLRDELAIDAGAKLRCGGESAEAVPAPADVARFILAARDAKVPLKATAGLHHPVRAFNEAAGFAMHGFLNVAGGTILASVHPAIGELELERLIADEDPDHFALDAHRFRWLEREADAEGIGRARALSFRSYGSCSFDEPLADLRAMGWLGRA